MTRRQISIIAAAAVALGAVLAAAGSGKNHAPKPQMTAPAQTVTGEQEESQLSSRRQAAGPGDDYYEYVNGEFLKEKEIPADSNSWSYFYQLKEEAGEVLNQVLKETVARREHFQTGTVEQKIADFYLCAADMDGRERAGFGALLPYLDAIRSAANIREYLEATGTVLGDLGTSSLLTFTYMADMADSDRYAVYYTGADLGIGKEMLEDPQMEAVRDRYRAHISRTMAFAGYAEAEADAAAKRILALQMDLAAAKLPLADGDNPELVYNPYTVQELAGLFHGADITVYLNAARIDFPEQIIVKEQEQAQQTAAWLTEENLPLLKEYAVFCLINDMSRCLTPEIRDNYLDWDHELKGVKEQKTDEKLAAAMTQEVLGFEFGRLYVERCFSEQDRQAIQDMVGRIIEAYEGRIMALDWMSGETKARAVGKLEHMTLKIGYPDVWPDYYGNADIISPENGGSLIDNVVSLARARRAYGNELVKKPVDRSVWNMTPQTVNAYYDLVNNEIVFPAAILQPPFYDREAPLEQNLGGIGMVIAHEISHAFDPTGALYDENGNYNMWWTEADMKKFQELSAEVAVYYDNQEGFEGRHVNGELTLGENVADLGSLACITSIVGDDTGGLRQLFRQYAVIWAGKYTDESMIWRLNIDVHSPGKVRVNAVASATDAFYKAYPEIKAGDAMYLAPQERPGIW